VDAPETAESNALPPALRGCVAFFGHDWQESTVVKRIRAFSGLGLSVVGFNFRRDKFARDFQPFWENVHLGTTQDRAYGKRLLALVRAVPTLVRHRHRLREAEFFYARNIDMCALALAGRVISGSRAPLVYEVLDVQRVFLGSGVVSRLFRWAERQLLQRSDLLVISSPGFDRHYFRGIQGYRGRLFLLENKISFAQATAVSRPAPGAAALSAQQSRPGKWVIGWFGTLRCPKSLDMRRRAARQGGDLPARSADGNRAGGLREGDRRTPEHDLRRRVPQSRRSRGDLRQGPPDLGLRLPGRGHQLGLAAAQPAL